METQRKATAAAPQTQGKDSEKSAHTQGFGAVNLFDGALAAALQKSTENGLHLPIDGFSAEVQDYIQNIEEAYQTNRDAVVLSCCDTGGVAAGKKLPISNGRYNNYMALYCCYVAPSGSNKSETIKAPTKPLRKRNGESYEAYQSDLGVWKSAKKNPDPRPAWRNQVIIGSDTTPEAKTQALSVTDGGLLQYSDELSCIFANTDRYAKGSGFTTYLSAFDGDEIIVNRKNDEAIRVDSPFLAILGSIQPTVLKSVFSEQMIHAGLPQRFLFAYQSEPSFAHYSEAVPDYGSVERWGNLIGSIFDRPSQTLVIGNGAKAVYKDFYDGLQDKKAAANPYMATALSKQQIQVIRLAGIVHVLNRNSADEISAKEMQFAVSFMPYFQRTQAHVYNALVGDERQLSKAEIVRQLFANFECVSQSAVAMAIGVDKGNLSKMLKK